MKFLAGTSQTDVTPIVCLLLETIVVTFSIFIAWGSFDCCWILLSNSGFLWFWDNDEHYPKHCAVLMSDWYLYISHKVCATSKVDCILRMWVVENMFVWEQQNLWRYLMRKVSSILIFTSTVMILCDVFCRRSIQRRRIPRSVRVWYTL